MTRLVAADLAKRAREVNKIAEVHSRAFAETPLHLADLEELIPGAQWMGSYEHIVAAIESAKHAGVKTDAKAPRAPATRGMSRSRVGRLRSWSASTVLESDPDDANNERIARAA